MLIYHSIWDNLLLTYANTNHKTLTSNVVPKSLLDLTVWAVNLYHEFIITQHYWNNCQYWNVHTAWTKTIRYCICSHGSRWSIADVIPVVSQILQLFQDLSVVSPPHSTTFVISCEFLILQLWCKLNMFTKIKLPWCYE